MSEDDILASSSAGWKAVALPEPAKMVSLPALAELPSAVEIEKKDKAARAAAKVEAAKIAAETKTETKTDAPAKTAAAVEAPVTSIGAHVAAKQNAGKGKTMAIAGVLLAAAAGVAIFFVVNKGDKSTSHSASAVETKKPETTMPALAPAPEVKAPEAPPVEQVAVAEPVVEPIPEPVVEDKPKAEPKKDKVEKVHKVEVKDERPAAKEPAKVAVKAEEPKPAAKEGDPDFDQLLKEAGVQEKKADKPKLDKKDLSAGDFKNGMGAVQSKAKACYTGTQGTASFKVSIAPSGAVESVKMKGQFAGTPEGSCVEAAVRGATFPAWDGAPKSFDFSYLLSD